MCTELSSRTPWWVCSNQDRGWRLGVSKDTGPGQGEAGGPLCSSGAGPRLDITDPASALVGVFGKNSKMTGIFQIACFSILRSPSPPPLALILKRTLKCVRNKKVKV